MYRHGSTRRRTAVTAGLAALVLAATVPVLAAPADAAPGTPARPGVLGETPALAQAHALKRPVQVTAATTTTSTLTADPDGSLELEQAVQPVRKLVDGVWKDLDATLAPTADGGIAPVTALGDLRLSAGKDTTIARMSGGGRSLALQAPFALPAPVLDGPTATYVDVLPGVDLAVTADTQGGFAEVLVVKTPDAADNPLLKTLTFGTDTTRLTLAADEAGNIAGTDVNGETVVTAPTLTMWDSSTTSVSALAKSTAATASSLRAPGSAAKVARVGVEVAPGKLILTPSAALLTRPGLTYPVYIDPTFSWLASGSSLSGWAVIGEDEGGTNFWKNSPSSQDDMQSGHDAVTGDTRRTLLSFTIDTAKLSGATINDATLNITETWSNNCDPTYADLYAPSKDLTSSNATWNSWKSVDLGSRTDQQEVAYGWSSDCKAHGVPFDILTPVKADVGSGNKTQTFVLKADSESSSSGWKRWDKTTPKITIHYDHAPSKPTGLKTSPTTSCTGSTIGDSAVKLYATVADPDGGTVGEKFSIWKTSNSAVIKTSDPNKLTAPSGSGAVPFTVDESWLKTSAGGAVTSFSWNIQITDFKYTATSGTCSFSFDPTRTGAPEITDPAAATIGSPATFTIAKPKTGTIPSSYQYQLNGGPLSMVDATAAGDASITVVPTRFTNVLTVTSLSAGDNIGDTSAEPFSAQPAALAADGDLTGDGAADLLTVGSATAGLPAGLWLAPGTGDRGVDTAATNLATNGNGTQGDHSPHDFDGAQAITGHFTGGSLQDLLYYYPAGTNVGGGGVLNGNGDGSPIDAEQSGVQHTITPGSLSDFNDLNPMSLANAGTSAHPNNPFPDLIGVTGDSSSGYYLNYYPNQGDGALLDYAFPTSLAVPAPDGTMSWKSWTIATAQLADQSTDMFLWNRDTGALHLWTGITFDVNSGTFSYQRSTVLADGVSTFFNKASTGTLRAADINKDGMPDLWVGGASGSVISWLVSAPADGSAGSVSAQAPQTLNTAAHAWLLNDGTDGAVGQAVDSSGTLNGTGSGAAAWNTGDLYDPDVSFNGTTSVITAPKAVSTTADFSVSVWAKPMAYSGNVLSQDGVNGVGFKIWPSTDTAWHFAMPQADTPTTTTVWDTAQSAAGTAKLGAWYHITATYQQSTKRMTLFINGVQAGATNHTTPWSANGNFKIGTMRTTSTTWGYNFNGQIADVQTWNSVITPTLIANYDMRGGSGASITDWTGFGNTATLTGGYTWNTTGHGNHNGSITFNGSTGYAAANATLLQPASTSFSLSSWVYLTNTTAQHTVFSQDGTNRSPFYLQYLDSTNKWQFSFSSADVASPTWYTAQDPNPAPLNIWTHVVGTYDAGTHTARLYINGNLVATCTNVTTWNSPGKTWLGRSKSTWWQGKIDSARIYQGVLNQDQIRQVMAAG